MIPDAREYPSNWNRATMKGEEVAMRTRKVLFSFAIVATAGLLAATTAMAAPPASCTTDDGLWYVATNGPIPFSCSAGPCSEIDYAITPISPNSGTPDHVAVLVGGTNRGDVLVPSGVQVYPAGAGDPVTLLGLGALDWMAVKVNPGPYKEFFPLVVRGGTPITTMIAVKKGRKPAGLCQIKGLTTAPADDTACVPSCGRFHPFQALKQFETIVFKGCAVKFEYDLTTGEVVNAELDPDNSPSPTCNLTISDVGDLELSLPGLGSLGHGKFGDGYISSNDNSCTSKVIGGRLYTWGNPCP